MNIPDVTLHDLDRQPVNLKTFEGKKTIIAFFPGAFTIRGPHNEMLLKKLSIKLFAFFFLL